jgi:hypothetical protein
VINTKAARKMVTLLTIMSNNPPIIVQTNLRLVGLSKAKVKVEGALAKKSQALVAEVAIRVGVTRAIVVLVGVEKAQLLAQPKMARRTVIRMATLAATGVM